MRTCGLFLCSVAIVRVRAIVLTSLFSLFYVTGEFHRFLHRGRAENSKIVSWFLSLQLINVSVLMYRCLRSSSNAGLCVSLTYIFVCSD